MPFKPGPVTDPKILANLRKRFERMPDNDRKKMILAKFDQRIKEVTAALPPIKTK